MVPAILQGAILSLEKYPARPCAGFENSEL